MGEVLTYSAFESRFRDKTYIGSGGFAKVYKVFDFAKNHYVALKVADVRPEWKQFTLQREVELVNRLPEHRNIARYDACYRFNTGITGEMDFAILRFYESGNLEQFLSRENLTDEDKRILIQGILEGIAFLHQNNVVHRDLKAQNILMSREDGVWTPKITDFGLSRQIGGDFTIANSSIGISYAYAAPEQIQNLKIGKNVDLWSAGVLIYRILEGELPFLAHKGMDERSSQYQLEISRRIVNLELPASLAEVAEPYQSMIRRCLTLDPKERVQHAEELLEMLHGQTEILHPQEPDQHVGVQFPDQVNVWPGAKEQTEIAFREETELLGGYQGSTRLASDAAIPDPARMDIPVHDSWLSAPVQVQDVAPGVEKPRERKSRWLIPLFFASLAVLAISAWYLMKGPGANTPFSPPRNTGESALQPLVREDDSTRIEKAWRKSVQKSNEGKALEAFYHLEKAASTAILSGQAANFRERVSGSRSRRGAMSSLSRSDADRFKAILDALAQNDTSLIGNR